MNETINYLCKEEGFTTLPVDDRHWRAAFSMDDTTSGPRMFYDYPGAANIMDYQFAYYDAPGKEEKREIKNHWSPLSSPYI